MVLEVVEESAVVLVATVALVTVVVMVLMKVTHRSTQFYQGTDKSFFTRVSALVGPSVATPLLHWYTQARTQEGGGGGGGGGGFEGVRTNPPFLAT